MNELCNGVEGGEESLLPTVTPEYIANDPMTGTCHRMKMDSYVLIIVVGLLLGENLITSRITVVCLHWMSCAITLVY